MLHSPPERAAPRREGVVTTRHVLVVDDEAHIREVVEYALTREGFRVSVAADGRVALDLAERDPPNLVVLDVMLPEVDGLEVCRKLRRGSQVPILFLSARSEEIDRIVGLELGGDDYLGKPFSPRELVARVRAVLRRFESAPKEAEARPVAGAREATARTPARRRAPLKHLGLEIDFERHEVRCSGTRVDLTPTELEVLAALIERPGVVLSRAQLMARGQGDGVVVTERTIDTHVRRIRAKFRQYGVDPVETVHGVGYRASGG